MHDGHARVQRGEGILEDNLQVGAEGAQGGGGGAGDVDAFEMDFAAMGRLQAEDRAGEGGFAAARFTDEGEGFAGSDFEGNAVNGADVADGVGKDAAADGVPDAEVGELEEGAR